VTVLQFRPEAAADLEEAAEWYEAQKRGLGLEFLDQVQATLDRIAETLSAIRSSIAIHDECFSSGFLVDLLSTSRQQDSGNCPDAFPEATHDMESDKMTFLLRLDQAQMQ